MTTEMVRVIGLPALEKKLKDPAWAYRPMGAFLDRWRFFTRGQTAQNMEHGSQSHWFWHGASMGSVKSERDTATEPKWARVFSDKDTVRWGEYGTGTLSEDPLSKHRQYFPPPMALAPWAAEHGTTGYMVALGIFRQGGTAPRHFMRDAFDEAEKHVPRWERMMATDIEREAAAGGD